MHDSSNEIKIYDPLNMKPLKLDRETKGYPLFFDT